MANNYVKKGDRMLYTNGSGVTITAGSPVLVGKIFGVACVDIPDGESENLIVDEVYEIRKANGVINQGADLYWDADGNPQGSLTGNGLSGTGCLTTTDSGNTYAGRAFKAAGATDTTVEIKLNA